MVTYFVGVVKGQCVIGAKEEGRRGAMPRFANDECKQIVSRHGESAKL